MSRRFEEEAARLAGLPRAERFACLIEFPTEHTFKVIGRAQGLGRALELALEGAGRPGVCLIERPSARGTYVSFTFTTGVASAAELDELYTLLEGLPGLACLL
jgi:putative lipoic acid-binding regulatory protein